MLAEEFVELAERPGLRPEDIALLRGHLQLGLEGSDEDPVERPEDEEEQEDEGGPGRQTTEDVRPVLLRVRPRQTLRTAARLAAIGEPGGDAAEGGAEEENHREHRGRAEEHAAIECVEPEA